MTRRYAIIARGDPEQRRQIAAAAYLPIIDALASALVLTEQAGPPRRLDGALLIGDAFDKTGRSLGAVDLSGSRPLSPASLVENAWGQYIAVFDDGELGLRILRDPSGALGCYYRHTADLIVIASDLALLERIAGSAHMLDWDEIGRMLVEVDLRGPRTGLTGTHELLPGMMLAIRPAATIVTQCWSPWGHVGTKPGTGLEDQATRLRDRIDTVVGALANRHRKAVVTVSGGLDSSIVALSMPRQVELTCLTLATDDPSGDERRYARLVAAAAARDYAEAMLGDGSIDLDRSQAAHLPRPIGRPFLVPMIDAFERTIRARGATAIFNGLGGDNVFCFLQSATPAADRLTSGDGIGALTTVGDIARMTGASYVQVAAAAVKRAIRGRKSRPWRRDSRFVPIGLAHDVRGFAHPWLQSVEGSRLGVDAHVAMLLRIQNYLDPWSADWPIEVVNPLLAQPIVECCLGIPTWLWCQGGVDRAVARNAFADLLPPAIQQRTWKGGPDGFIAGIVDRRRASIRTMLLGGMLAGHGLIDRLAVSTTLDDARPIQASDALRLLSLADTEAWVRTYG